MSSTDKKVKTPLSSVLLESATESETVPVEVLTVIAGRGDIAERVLELNSKVSNHV